MILTFFSKATDIPACTIYLTKKPLTVGKKLRELSHQ